MTPLVETIRAVLRDQGAQSPESLRKSLRRVRGAVPLDQLERTLREHSAHFRPLGNGRWDLAERLADPDPRPASNASGVPVDPLVAGSLRDDFVAIDVETTGRDQVNDEIVQLAAVRFRAGRPVAAVCRHVRPQRGAIPEPLRVRMGWERIPEEAFTPVAQMLEDVRTFIGSDAVVAWNADFDRAFLAAVDVVPSAWIDALAVGVLADPVGPHRLTSVLERLNIDPVATLPRVALDGPAREAKAHDALYDALGAGLVHTAYVQKLRGGVGPDVAALLPEMRLNPEPSEPAALVPAIDRSAKRPSADPEAVLADIVDATGRQHRSHQAEVTRLAAAALRGASGMVEAPTGTGKTLAYLAAALAATAGGGRVALVTAYKNLQDQLVDELDAAVRAAELDVGFAVLKGADNYLCRERLARVAERLDASDGENRYICAVLTRLTDRLDAPTREDVPAWLVSRFHRSGGLIDEVAVACSHTGCGRVRALERANSASLVVMNQVLWLQPPKELIPATYAVIDEAHDLEQMATLAFTEEVGSHQLLGLASRLEPPGRSGLLSAARHAGGDIGATTQLMRRLRATAGVAHLPLARFATAVSGDVSLDDGGKVRLRRAPMTSFPGPWRAAEDILRDLRECLTALAVALGDLAESIRTTDRLVAEDLRRLSERARELEDLLFRLPAVREAAFVHYLEIGPAAAHAWRLARCPVEVAPVLEDVWDSLGGFLLISATLQTGPGDFTFLVDRLGLRGRLPGGAHIIGSDFPFSERVLLGVARWFDALPVPRFMPEFEAETADEITNLATFGDGRLLGLFTAHRRLQGARDVVAEPLAAAGIPVLAQGDGSRQSLLEDFRARPEAVLLGTSSFWQGVDVPGPSLSFLLIEKLPFPHLRDPVTEARLDLIKRRSGNEFEDYLLPAMTIGFKQGFGRLMRQADDRGVVLLCDRRFHAKAYRDQVLGALPGFIPRDATAETERRAFYERIDETFPGLISAFGRQYLAALPEHRPGAVEWPVIPAGGSRQVRRPAVLRAMSELFRHDGFRSEEQEELFWRIHDGDDVIGLLPTGAGKSLPFQLSALLSDGLTLVVSPLVALMRDQVEQLLGRGLRSVAALVGHMTADERDEVLRRAGNGAVRLLYAAPERLRDPVFLDHLRRLPLRRVVVDEAHCVSLWGPSFRPDFLAIRATLEDAGHGTVPRAALTATATPEIERDIRRALGMQNAARVATSFARPELRFAVLGSDPGIPAERIANDKDRLRLLLRILVAAERRGEAAIVYVPTVARARQVSAQLAQVGLAVRAYHAQLDDWDRRAVEDLFRDGELDVVVATKAFGMGIDRSDVRYVIHLGFPSDLESYYQEAGRAGRDRLASWCLVLPLAAKDRSTQEWFIDQTRDLDATLSLAHAELTAEGPGRRYLRLGDLAERLGIDETGARVALHHLESAGVLRRFADQTITASVIEVESPSQPVVRRALDWLDVSPMVRISVPVVEVASSLGMTPEELEAAFLECARTGEVVYRPFERAAVIEVTQDAPPHAPDTTGVVARMMAKLDTMATYATSHDECRQVTLRGYLGEAAATPCGTCDVCDPRFERPWLEVTADALPEPDRLLDPQLVCLAGVDWNAREVQAGRSPYGMSSLRHLLAGDRYQLGQYVQGVNRERRIRRAEASPYWAALSLLTNPKRQIDAAVDALVGRCEVTTAIHRPSDRGESGPTTYEYPVLTPLGQDRLEKGLFT